MIGWADAIILAVAAERGAELVLARRNSARLLAQGGREAGQRHYPLLVGLHFAWLVALVIAAPPDRAIHWGLIGFFGALQIARVWVLVSLGPFWTTRIITLDRTPLRRRGPYRFLRHPNYVVVGLEIIVLPLAFGLPQIAAAFGAANLALLAWRIRVENRELAGRAALSS